jgi:hypothetical protein
MYIASYFIKIALYLNLLCGIYNFVTATTYNVNFVQFGDYITDDVYYDITNFKKLTINDVIVSADEEHIASGRLQFNPEIMQSLDNITVDTSNGDTIARSQRLGLPLGGKKVFGYISDVQARTQNGVTCYSIKNSSALYLGIVPYKLQDNQEYNFGIFTYKATKDKPAMVIDSSIKNTIFDNANRIQGIFICGDLDGSVEDTLQQTALLINHSNINNNKKKLLLPSGIVIAKTAHLISGSDPQNCGLKISAINNSPYITIGNIINYGYIFGVTAIDIGSANSCFPLQSIIGTTSRIVNYGEITALDSNVALSVSGAIANEYNAVDTLQLTNYGIISGKLLANNSNNSVKLSIVNKKHINIPATSYAINATNYTASSRSVLKIIFNNYDLKLAKPIINSESFFIQKEAKIVLSGENFLLDSPVEINMVKAEDIILPIGGLDDVLYSQKFSIDNNYYILIADPNKYYKYNKKIIKLQLSLIKVDSSFPDLVLIKDYLKFLKN